MNKNFELAKISDTKFDIVLLEKGLHILVGLTKIGFDELEGRDQGLEICFKTIRESSSDVS